MFPPYILQVMAQQPMEGMPTDVTQNQGDSTTLTSVMAMLRQLGASMEEQRAELQTLRSAVGRLESGGVSSGRLTRDPLEDHLSIGNPPVNGPTERASAASRELLLARELHDFQHFIQYIFQNFYLFWY